MTWEMTLQESVREGIEIGRVEGKEIGRTEAILQALKEGLMTLENASKILKVPEEKLLEMVK